MPARLFCKTGELAGSSYTIGHEATIGRTSDNEITLHPTIISGRHARIYFDPAQQCYLLEDLESSNGTALDGVAVREAVRLGPLHVITFAGQFDFFFQETPVGAVAQPTPPPRATPARETVAEAPTPVEADEPGERTVLEDLFAPTPPRPATQDEKTQFGDGFPPVPPLRETAPTPPPAPDEPEKTRMGDPFAPMPPLQEATGTAPPAPAPPVQPESDETILVRRPPDAPPRFELDVTLPEEKRLTFVLKEGENVLGRDSASDLVVPLQAVSRRHALFTVRAGRVTVQDLGSKNFTYVAAQRITAEVEVTPGTPVRFGYDVEAQLRRIHPDDRPNQA